MMISVNSIDFKGSLVNGPGVRTLLFLQGCDRYCPGCHNTATWDIDKGQTYKVSELSKIIKEGCRNGKITITGGEPLYQKEALVELLNELKGMNICLYTSYELEEIPREIVDKVNYIKTGRFNINKRTTTTPYYGSTNQRFITIKEE